MGQFAFGLLAGIIVGLVMEWVIDWTGLLPRKRVEEDRARKPDSASKSNHTSKVDRAPDEALGAPPSKYNHDDASGE